MYITNKDSYYFVVNCEVDVTKLVDCKIHASLEEMYAYVCATYDLELDEVEGMHFVISEGFSTDDRGCKEEVTSVEDYINNFEM